MELITEHYICEKCKEWKEETFKNMKGVSLHSRKTKAEGTVKEVEKLTGLKFD